MSEETKDARIDWIAMAAHEANRAYCASISDDSQLPWANAPDWQRTSATKGVLGVIAGNSPEQSHASWLREKEETGWKYGPVKDPEKKEHPCMVPYSDLPPEQRAKDAIFVTAVLLAAENLGLVRDPEFPSSDERVETFAIEGVQAMIDAMSEEQLEGAIAPRDTSEIPVAKEISPATAEALIGELTSQSVLHAVVIGPIGQHAYSGYLVTTGGKTHDGKPCPEWHALPTRIQEAWTNSATVAIRVNDAMRIQFAPAHDPANAAHEDIKAAAMRFVNVVEAYGMEPEKKEIFEKRIEAACAAARDALRRLT